MNLNSNSKIETLKIRRKDKWLVVCESKKGFLSTGAIKEIRRKNTNIQLHKTIVFV